MPFHVRCPPFVPKSLQPSQEGKAGLHLVPLEASESERGDGGGQAQRGGKGRGGKGGAGDGGRNIHLQVRAERALRQAKETYPLAEVGAAYRKRALLKCPTHSKRDLLQKPHSLQKSPTKTLNIRLRVRRKRPTSATDPCITRKSPTKTTRKEPFRSNL